MGRIPKRFLVHRVEIEPYLGRSGTGQLYGPMREARCLLDEKTRNVRSPSGDLVVSSSTAYCPPGTTAPALSRVTLPDGRRTTVIASLNRDAGRLGTPDHVEVQLE